MSNHDAPKQKPKKTESDSSSSEEDKIDLSHVKALAHKTMKNLCLLDVASFLPGGTKKVKTIVPINKTSDDGSSNSSTNLERQKPIQDMTSIVNEAVAKDDDESASSSEMSSYLEIDDLKGDMMIFYRSLNGESSTFQLSQSLMAVNDLEDPTETDCPTSSTQTNNVPKLLSTPTSKVRIHTERTTESNPILPRTREIGTSTSVFPSEGPENPNDRVRNYQFPFIGEMIGDDVPMRQYLYELTTALYLAAPRPIEPDEGPDNPDYPPPGPARRNQGTSTSPENFHGDFYG